MFTAKLIHNKDKVIVWCVKKIKLWNHNVRLNPLKIFHSEVFVLSSGEITYFK